MPIVHQKLEIRFVGGTPQEAVNAHVFVLLVRISDKGLEQQLHACAAVVEEL